MRTLKMLALTLLLTVGLGFPSCEVGDSCDGVVFRNFFNITDLDYLAYSSYDEFDSGELIPAGDTIAFSELDRIYIDYIVNYVVSNEPKRDWSFSLIPSAYACSYFPGLSGSKEEELIDFSITTLNDFDDEHLANSNINDLFTYHGFYSDLIATPIPLTQYLDNQSGKLADEDMVLELQKAPELNEEFKVRVRLELSTGEVYEIEPAPFYIRP